MGQQTGAEARTISIRNGATVPGFAGRAIHADDGEVDQLVSLTMDEKSEWTTADFETLSWHDCHVHGFRLEEKEHGTAEVEFDIDFIVQWLCHEDRLFEFRVAPATLIFHDVSDLRLELDYATVGAGMTPFSIAGIERESMAVPNGYSLFRWRMPINWPTGLITFQSPAFTQLLRSAPILVARQGLLPKERD